MGSIAADPLVVDVLIVGGGYAGLSAAFTLYRALHTCIIFDAHKPRNWYGSPIRLTPQWEDQDPEKVRNEQREELSRSGFVRFVDEEVKGAEKTAEGLFRATAGDGKEWLGRRLLIATGAVDVFPDVKGYAECYTKGIFPCMFQFGYEQRGASSAGLLALGTVANSFFASKLAEDGLKFSSSLTIYTSGNEKLVSELKTTIEDPAIKVDDRKISHLVQGKTSEVTINFEDGSSVTEAFIVHRPLVKLDTQLPDLLGLEYGSFGEIKANPPFLETSVPGVFAAGDCATHMRIIPNALSMGAYAGAGLARGLPRSMTGNDYR